MILTKTTICGALLVSLTTATIATPAHAIDECYKPNNFITVCVPVPGTPDPQPVFGGGGAGKPWQYKSMPLK